MGLGPEDWHLDQREQEFEILANGGGWIPEGTSPRGRMQKDERRRREEQAAGQGAGQEAAPRWGPFTAGTALGAQERTEVS